jgi:multidrug efflux system membrane fusion protein
LFLVPCLLLTGLSGCEKPVNKGGDVLKDVNFAVPFQRPVAEYVYYTGRINAKDTVTIQSRVTGMLLKWHRKEGEYVGKDEILCEIDPAPFEAQLNASKAAVNQAIAAQSFAVATYKRYKDLHDKIKGSVSEQELEQYKAQEEQAKANLDLARENAKLATLNRDWTKVTAPIAGRMSRFFKTPGNIINQDSTVLTTIVSMDPVYAYFDVDEPTLLRIKQAIDAGEMSPIRENKNQVMMKLVDEATYTHLGSVNFLDNQVNPGTGSISVRGEFANPKIKGESYKLLPGMFVRIQLPIGQAKNQYLIRDQVILTEQQGKYVWVIDQESRARKRSVKLGQLQDDGMRVILPASASKDGKNWLKADDKIIVNQLLRISEGLLLENPHQVDMQPKTAGL